MRIRTALALALGSLLVAAPGAAQSFWAPEYLQSQPGGDFSFKAKFTAGPGGATIANDQWYGEVLDGVINVQGTGFSDCPCSLGGCPLGPGETWEVDVDGSLIDPDAPGRVAVSVGLCSGAGEMELVTVTPFTPAPTPALPPWAVLGLAVLLPAAGFLWARRRHRA